MEIINIIIYVLLGIVSLAGLVLVVINLPGIWLIYISTIILAIMDKFENITPLILVIKMSRAPTGMVGARSL